MKHKKVPIIVAIAIISIAALLYFIYSNTAGGYQWFENYRASSDQPYGASFVSKMLATYRDGTFILNEKKPLRLLLEDVDNHGRTDYVFIGQNMFLDEKSTQSLARFIEAGGNAFIASLTPPEQIIGAVYYQECGSPVEYSYNHTDSVRLNFLHNGLKLDHDVSYAFHFGTEDLPYSWDYVAESVFCDSTSTIAALGFQDNERINFMRIRVGEGSLYLHSNPLVFTNYFMTKREHVTYAAGVFSHLDGRDMIWDEYSKIPLPGGNAYNSPLYFILQQPSLKYAWWLLLCTVLLYVVFGAKRKQRVIPVLETKSNTSLELVNLISRLHFRNGNHLDMAHKKMRYFLYFIRSRYGIHAERFSQLHIQKLAEKAKVRISDVELIFSRYYLIEERFKNNIEADRLVDLHDAIDNFYRQSKQDQQDGRKY